MTFTQYMFQAFKIGCIGFGGGNALLPLLEDAFVKDGSTSQKEEFDKDIIAASLTPGALPVEVTASIGYRRFGYRGMIGGACMITLPGIFATLLLLTILSKGQATAHTIFQYVSIAISAFVIYLILKYAKNTLEESRKVSPKFFKRAILVTILVCFFTCGKQLYALLEISGTPAICLSTAHLLLATFGSIIFVKLCQRMVRSRRTPVHVLQMSQLPYEDIMTNLCVWFLLMATLTVPAALLDYHVLYYVFQGGLSTLMSFGGGDAYLAVADGLFVDNGMLSEDLFYGTIVPVVNILPGSILSKTLPAIGLCYSLSLENSLLTSVLFGLAGIGCSISVSCGVFFIVRLLYNQFSHSSILLTMSHYIRPIITGLLVNVILLLLVQNKETAGLLSLPAVSVLCYTILLAAIDYTLSKKCKPFFLICINLVCVFIMSVCL